MVNIKIENISNAEENIIVHQVNVQGIMRRWSCKTTRQPLSRIRTFLFTALQKIK